MGFTSSEELSIDVAIGMKGKQANFPFFFLSFVSVARRGWKRVGLFLKKTGTFRRFIERVLSWLNSCTIIHVPCNNLITGWFCCFIGGRSEFLIDQLVILPPSICAIWFSLCSCTGLFNWRKYARLFDEKMCRTYVCSIWNMSARNNFRCLAIWRL